MPKFKPGDKVRIFSKIDYNPFLNSYKGKTVTVISAHDWIVDEKKYILFVSEFWRYSFFSL